MTGDEPRESAEDSLVLSSETPTSPHLSRMLWLSEQMTVASEELAVMVGSDAVLADLTGAELDAVRHAAQQARTAGGDVRLVASAAHHRARRAG